MWSRLTGALGALALLGCSIFIAIFIAVADIRDALPGHQGVPADQVIWSIVGVCTGIALIAGALKVLRSEAFRSGIRRPAIVMLGLAAALFVSYGATQFGAAGAAYFQTGFHGYAYSPHPTLDFPLDVACGDQSHCIVESLVGGTALGPPGVGFATSSNGGLAWHSIRTGSFGEPAALSCTGATCWGLFPNRTSTSAFIASINILPSGHPQIALRRAVLPLGAQGGNYFGWSTCNSATHCVSFVTTHQVIHSEGIVAHLSVDATDDAGAHWTSQEIATGASSSISPPDGYARSGPWCDPNGQCLALGTAENAICETQPHSAQEIVALQSSDDGVTWSQSQTMPPAPSSNGILDVSCQAIPVCTANWTPTDGRTVVSTSMDFGASWQPFTSLGGAGTLKCTAELLCMKALLVGSRPSQNVISASFDDGRTWRTAPVKLKGSVTVGAMGCATIGPCIMALESQGAASFEMISTSDDGSWLIRSLPTPSLAKIAIDR